MRRFYELSMNSGRRTELTEEELEDDHIDEESNLFYDEDDFDDDEPYEREYCD